jgi:hypothetical protein
MFRTVLLSEKNVSMKTDQLYAQSQWKFRWGASDPWWQLTYCKHCLLTETFGTYHRVNNKFSAWILHIHKLNAGYIIPEPVHSTMRKQRTWFIVGLHLLLRVPVFKGKAAPSRWLPSRRPPHKFHVSPSELLKQHSNLKYYLYISLFI